jgi:hypothetical protein
MYEEISTEETTFISNRKTNKISILLCIVTITSLLILCPTINTWKINDYTFNNYTYDDAKVYTFESNKYTFLCESIISCINKINDTNYAVGVNISSNNTSSHKHINNIITLLLFNYGIIYIIMMALTYSYYKQSKCYLYGINKKIFSILMLVFLSYVCFSCIIYYTVVVPHLNDLYNIGTKGFNNGGVINNNICVNNVNCFRFFNTSSIYNVSVNMTNYTDVNYVMMKKLNDIFYIIYAIIIIIAFVIYRYINYNIYDDIASTTV